MLFAGVVSGFGVVYYTMLEPKDGLNAVDGLVAALLLIGSLGYIAAARKLRLHDAEIWLAAVGFALLHAGMSALNVFGYDASEIALFLGLDVVILVLIASIRPADQTAPVSSPQTSK
jgi:hypothetical protein